MSRQTGRYIETTTEGETVKAFVPASLPPVPPLERTPKIQDLVLSADAAIRELKTASDLVPNPDFFNYAFIRKEAVLSSQIEGIQATLSDLLNFEADPERASADIQEVCNYLDALNFARKQLQDPKGLPVSLRLIKEMHMRLMKGVRGASKQPRHFRESQNWVAGARPGNAPFVPPPPAEVIRCLSELESYLHEPREKDQEHPLIRIGLAHVQFETIHPFLNGNGRVGRLLIALLLEAWNLLDSRLLYLSVYFRRNQQEYYERLSAVRTSGDWEGWTQFYLTGICESCGEAVKTARELFKTLERDRRKLLSHKKVVVPAIRLFEELPSHPVLTSNQVVALLETTKPTAAKAIEVLMDAGILQETTGGKRNRVFGYKKYLDVLKTDEGEL
ncbi:MAG: Fic family protein [Bdellovibrionia bacterium]